MQQQQTPAGPLTTPKAFRRSTGAHAILVSLVLADLAGFLLALAIGAIFWPPIWALLQVIILLLHDSLLLAVGLVVILWSLAHGILGQLVLKKKAQAAWKRAGPLILATAGLLLLIALLKTSWMTIPSPLPAITVEPVRHWPLPLSVPGMAVAAGLWLLAHLIVLWRDRRETAEKLRTFSRAHPGGSLCRLLEQVYSFYRRGLARFEQPPVQRLKTPPMFFFFPRRPSGEGEDELDALAHPEREIYLVGRELVICQAHLGPKPEQTEILLPLVARLLHDYNSPVARVERLLHLAELGQSVLCFWPLVVPITAAYFCRQRWHELERDRVLDRDRFAWECGEGKRLRKLLSRQLGHLHRTGKPDNAVPTLAERLDHLDSLLRTEAQQVKELHTTLPPASPPPPAAP